MAAEVDEGEVLTLRAYVGRSHSPCGECGVLVWLVEGCEHIKGAREQTQRDHTRAARRERERIARAKVFASVAAFNDLRTV